MEGKRYKEENQRLKIENGTLKEKISTQLQNNADNVNFMENQRREIEQLKQAQKQLAIDKLEILQAVFASTIIDEVLRNYVCSIIRGEIENLIGEGK